MKSRNGIPAWLLLGLLVAAALIALVACGGGGAPAGPVSFAVDESTRWGDLVGQFSGAERECIRAELGEETYLTVLGQPAAESAIWAAYPEPWAEVWEVFLWGCLAQETAVGLFWANIAASTGDLAGFYSDSGLRARIESGEFAFSEACVRKMAQYLDFGRVLTSGVIERGLYEFLDDYDTPAFFLRWAIVSCTDTSYELNDSYPESEPRDLFYVSAADVLWRDAIRELEDAEIDCLRTELGERYDAAMDSPLLRDRPEPWEVTAWGCLAQESAARLFAANAQWQTRRNLGGVLGQNENSAQCARRALARVDYPALIAASLPNPIVGNLIDSESLVISLLYCRPDAVPGTYADYAQDAIGASAIAVGGTAAAALDYPNDRDAFVFQAEAGVNYRIELAPKFLGSFIKLREASGAEIASAEGNWDVDRPARISWQAPHSGEYQITAGTGYYDYDPVKDDFGFGPYTLSLTAVPQP